MRLLLISDTHGKLDIINELSAQTQADAVIHAGDLGFYDDESFERLSNRAVLGTGIDLLNGMLKFCSYLNRHATKSQS